MNKKMFVVRGLLLVLFGVCALVPASQVSAAPTSTFIVNETNDELNNDSIKKCAPVFRGAHFLFAVSGIKRRSTQSEYLARSASTCARVGIVSAP